MSQIVSITYRPAEAPAKPDDHFTRLPLANVQLVAGYGIEGDRKGGHPDRQLNIMAQESLDELGTEGFMVKPGQMGEQIIVSGLAQNLNAMPEGTQLQFGDEAIIEIVKPRTGCDRFEAIQGKPPSTAADRLGMMARVLQGGTDPRWRLHQNPGTCLSMSRSKPSRRTTRMCWKSSRSSA